MNETSTKTLMRPIFIPVTVLVLTLVASAADKPPKPPKTPPAPKAHANAGPGGGPAAPKRSTDQQIEKLANMSPAQREKALSNLPPEPRQKIEAGAPQTGTAAPAGSGAAREQRDR